MHERLRLNEAACEAEVDFAFRKRDHLNFDRHAQRIVDRKQRATAIEITRRHRVFVLTEERHDALLQRTGNMKPAKLMNRRIETRRWWQFYILCVLARVFEAELILQEKR